MTDDPKAIPGWPGVERLAVTGATGFLGRHLVERALLDGVPLRVLVRDPARVPAAWRRSDVVVVAGDVEIGAACERLVAGASHVAHLAALVGGGGIAPERYRAVHVDATRTLVEAAAAAGARRFLHVGSVGIYGDVGRGTADEETPPKPEDDYERSKWEGEVAARAAGRANGLDVVVVRPAGIYGPGDRRLAKLFRGAARGRFPRLGRGTNRYHLVYVDDVVEGLRLALVLPQARERDYVLADAAPVALGDLLVRIARAAGRRSPGVRLPLAPVQLVARVCAAVLPPLGIPPPLYPERVAFFTKERAYSIERARRELGWEPRVPLDDGIRRTLASYRAAGWL